MTLAEVREKYEEGVGSTMLVVTRNRDNGYRTVFVVLKEEESALCHLHRYFPTGYDPKNPNWECSLDLQRYPLEDCLTFIEIDFREIYPR